MNSEKTTDFIQNQWDTSIRQTIEDYIRIPCLSPAFDPEWSQNGKIREAMDLLHAWVVSQNLRGTVVSLQEIEGRTPLLVIEIEGTGSGNVLCYGHMDKQPPFTGWHEGLSAFEPVLREDRLYGRGAADDGYAIFSSITAIKALQEQGEAHPRCFIVIEATEESGSPDLPAHIDALRDRIGTPDLIVCLDSGAATYDRLWLTTSLRGLVGGTLRVDIVEQGLHSGGVSGMVPSSFRILRQLISRIEDEQTGRVLLDVFHTEIPEERQRQMVELHEALGTEIVDTICFVDNASPMHDSVLTCIEAHTWHPTLSVTGADGLPPTHEAGNVLRPFTSVKLSLRIPPGVSAEEAGAVLKQALEDNPPYNARVSFTLEEPANGWDAPATAPWLHNALTAASETHFGKSYGAMGEGGTIPFMAMLGEAFPEAQFVITGVLGPESNAHGPNEFLHVPMFHKVTACIADTLHALTQK